MKTVILVLTKGPHRTRFGPEHWWDWKRQCRLAVELYRKYPDAVVLLPSAVHITGHKSEIELYREEFKRDGLLESTKNPDGRNALVLEPVEQETVGQIKRGYQFADTLGMRLVVVSTWCHYLRVRYLCRGMGVTHKIAWGIPNPVEAVTDCILAVVFPLLDLFGAGKRFQKWAIKHRESGKHI